MNSKDIFLKQLRACHNKNGWFVSLHSAVNGLTAEQALWKSIESTNSIWEIVNHLIFYNRRYLHRFKETPLPQTEVNSNKATFNNLNDEDWQSTIININTIMSEWVNTVKDSQEDKVESWSSDLVHLTIHNAYHIGQIVHIRKQQGTWNPKQGVH
jgi:uncharacterized damage-inducible protein DinB